MLNNVLEDTTRTHLKDRQQRRGSHVANCETNRHNCMMVKESERNGYVDLFRVYVCVCMIVLYEGYPKS